MKDFDKEFRKQIQEDTIIPDNINQLFSNFESEVNMNEKLKKGEFKIKLRNKVAAILATLSIISVGGVAFACAISEDVRTYVKSFLGIVSIEQYKEAKIDTNEVRENNGYSLTLEDYGIDAETLLLSFNLKTEDEIELEYPFMEEPTYFFYDMVKIVNENKDEYVITNEIIHGTDTKSTILLDKINSKEYKIYEIYTIDSSRITEGSELYIDFYLANLPEPATDLVYNTLCEFKLEVPINLEKIDDSFKEFSINNAVTTWSSYFISSSEFPNGGIGQVTAEITKIKNSNILTKLTLKTWGDYHTVDTLYTLKILNENNDILLDRDIEYYMPGVEQDIIIPRVDINSKLKIIFYEEEYVYNEKTKTLTKNDIATATMTLDLADIAE